ncbi:hypothetical protein [Oleiharenicola sp. Vm1]|uniref:hypothetical protein n=1 Tax=Oleiharenicola sp. Vm1 TaxID=3398393 RepID=UPI0039F5B86B
MPRALLVAAVVLGALASLYQGWDMFFRSPPRLMLQGTDDSFYYFWVRSAVVDGDLDFRNDLQRASTIDDPARVRAQAEPLTPLGRVRNKYPVGWAVATLPFFLVAHALALATSGPADGWQPVYFIVIWLGHVGYAVLGLLAARRVLAHYLDAGAATVGVLVGWLAGPLLYYQTARISMPHGLAFTLVALLYDRTLAAEKAPAGRAAWILGGASAGLLLITRPICAPYLLFPAGVLGRLLVARETRATALRRLPWAVGPTLALVALQLLAQRRLHGSWRFDTYDSEPFDFAHPHLVETFFSPQHGWFYWHPLLLVGIAAFIVAVLRGRLPRTWLVSLAVVAYVNASWWCWWWGSSFGNRSFEGATLFAMAGWGLLWAQAARAGRAVRALIGLGVTANVLLLALYMGGAISRGDPVTYPEMLAALLRQLARALPG